MSFVALISAAAWHYAGRGLAAWGISLLIIAVPYLLLGRFCFTRRHTADNRRYLFSE